MPRGHALVDRVRAALGGTPHVEEKEMFGGTTFMVRGKLCISARPARIMCRIDPAIHEVAVQRQGCRPVIMKGREYRGYVYVDAGGVRTKRDLERWIELALEYNDQAKASTREGAWSDQPNRLAVRRVSSSRASTSFARREGSRARPVPPRGRL